MKVLKRRTRTVYCSICGLELMRTGNNYTHTPEGDRAIERLGYPDHTAVPDGGKK